MNLWLRISGGITMTVGVLAIFLQPASVAHARVATASPEKSLSQVPFVGCKSDGQAGPLEAPRGKSKAVPITADIAGRLAYYKAEQGRGVLAPRGWYCFETYGSSGGNLYVAPQPIDPKAVFSDAWPGFAGPAIQLSGIDGGTSGRFGVAHIIARVFPAHRTFVRRIMNEGIDPSSSFHFGPYPQDQLTYKTKEIVEYETPANAEGLGTNSRLKRNDSPIRGVAILLGPSSEPSLSLLSARLPPNLSSLTATIIQQVELDAAEADQ